MMSSLLSLNASIWTVVFTHWIEITDFACLDSAFTNHGFRDEFHSISTSEMFYHGLETCVTHLFKSEFIEWLCLRRVKLTGHLKFLNLPANCFDLKNLQSYISTFKTLQLSHIDIAFLKKILSMYNGHVLSLGLCRMVDDDEFASIPVRCLDSLTTLNMARTKITDKSIDRMIHYARKLVRIDLYKCRELSPDSMTKLLYTYGDQLISFTPNVNITDEALMQFTWNSSLRLLNLEASIEISDVGLAHIAATQGARLESSMLQVSETDFLESQSLFWVVMCSCCCARMPLQLAH